VLVSANGRKGQRRAHGHLRRRFPDEQQEPGLGGHLHGQLPEGGQLHLPLQHPLLHAGHRHRLL